MAHIIEVKRHSKAEVCSFLDALFYSDSVSAIGYRSDNELIQAIAINWAAESENELDQRISQLITDALVEGVDLDEIAAFCRIFSETVLYKGELSDN